MLVTLLKAVPYLSFVLLFRFAFSVSFKYYHTRNTSNELHSVTTSKMLGVLKYETKVATEKCLEIFVFHFYFLKEMISLISML